MDRKREKLAIDLFNIHFKKNPVDCGLKVIDDFESKKCFLYATDNSAINSFKKCQKILGFFMLVYFWPLVIAFAIFMLVGTQHIISRDLTHPMLVVPCCFMIIWVILFIILAITALKANKNSKNKVVFIKY